LHAAKEIIFLFVLILFYFYHCRGRSDKPTATVASICHYFIIIFKMLFFLDVRRTAPFSILEILNLSFLNETNLFYLLVRPDTRSTDKTQTRHYSCHPKIKFRMEKEVNRLSILAGGFD
jgi:hypothetical protein